MFRDFINGLKRVEDAPSGATIKEQIKTYRAKEHRRVLFMFLIIAVIAVAAIYSCTIETMTIRFNEVVEIIKKAIYGIPWDSRLEEVKAKIIFERSMPRTVVAILVGMSLAIGGAMMQSVTRNPLTDSYTIGISSAAMLGVTIGVIYNVCIIPGFNGNNASMINAFVFALIPSAAIVLVSSFKKMSPTMMILIGIGIMYMFNAFSTFLKFNADPDALQEIYEWGLGTIGGIHDWSPIIPLIIGTCVIFGVGMYLANDINVLSSGDNMSKALGVRPVLTRVICFVAISVSTGICVCFTGTIGFVGLIGPHIARLFVGSDNKVLIPTSAILGALMILLADIAVRKIPGALPAGVITALIGAPIFMYILYMQRKKAAF